MRSYRQLLCACAIAFAADAAAQVTPAVNAVKLPDSLIFTATNANNNCTVVWHPVNQRYYSLRIGGVGFPLETWVPGSATSVCSATTAIDTRGMWYNPNNGEIERNCLGTLGWATFGIDAGDCATGASTTIFPGQLQATTQSCAAFNPVWNEVLSYSAATTSVQFRNRTTGAITQILLLTGTSFATVNTESIIWTGQSGYEIGLLDWSNKRVLLFNRATGAFAGQSQLPASAVTHAQFRFCYANHRVWLYTSTLRKWNAYCIWNQACDNYLPVELLGLEGSCAGGAPTLKWITGSERNSSHFVVERSGDLDRWETAGQLTAAGNSSQLLEYAFEDPHAPTSGLLYYRLQQVDLDGGQEHFGPVALAGCPARTPSLTAYPNPATDLCIVNASLGSEEMVALEVHDTRGRRVQTTQVIPVDETLQHTVDLSDLAPGHYVLSLRASDGFLLGRTALVRN